jgi:hypothetical protein
MSAETDRLRFEFLTAELELSFTFVRITRFEFDSGDQRMAGCLWIARAKGLTSSANS